MNFLLDRRALVVCSFLCFSLISSKSLTSISEKKLNEDLRQLDDSLYRGFLFHAIAAASSGKNFFKTSQTLSEDCIKTARVTMQLFEKPSTMLNSGFVLTEGVNEVVKYKANRTFDDLVNMLCENLNEQAEQNPFGLLCFEERKIAVQVPKPAKNYFVEIPSDQNVLEWAMNVSMPFDDPEVFKFGIIMQVLNFSAMDTVDKDLQEPYAIAQAIEKMSHGLIKSPVDKVFTAALDEFVKNLFSQGVDKVNSKSISTHLIEFMKEVDQDLLRNASLKDDYNKMKRESMNQASSQSQSLNLRSHSTRMRERKLSDFPFMIYNTKKH